MACGPACANGWFEWGRGIGCGTLRQDDASWARRSSTIASTAAVTTEPMTVDSLGLEGRSNISATQWNSLAP
jgi:hypothetical protein